MASSASIPPPPNPGSTSTVSPSIQTTLGSAALRELYGSSGSVPPGHPLASLVSQQRFLELSRFGLRHYDLAQHMLTQQGAVTKLLGEFTCYSCTKTQRNRVSNLKASTICISPGMGIIVYESLEFAWYGTAKLKQKTDWCPSICKGRIEKFSVKGARNQQTERPTTGLLLLYQNQKQITLLTDFYCGIVPRNVFLSFLWMTKYCCYETEILKAETIKNWEILDCEIWSKLAWN